MLVKDLFNKYKNLIIIVVLIAMIFLAWSIISTFSATTSDSAWDGTIAKEFTSGTGTEDNPYIISNASEFALFKKIMESDDAALYADKNFQIVNSFNYGKHDITINNIIPFSGTMDGNFNTINNAAFTKSLLNSIDNGTIKNIALKNINYNLENAKGAILVNSISNSTLNMIMVTGDILADSASTFGGLVYTSTNTTYNNIILNYNVSSSTDNNYKFAYSIDSFNGNNILKNNDGIKNTSSEIELNIDSFEVDKNHLKINNEDVKNFTSDNHVIVIMNDDFIFQSKLSNKENIKAPVRSTSFSTHTTGIDGTTVYINDLTADLNYFNGLNYAEVRNTNIPSGVSTGYYDAENLVKVQIVYDGTDINNSSLGGAVSPISTENINKYVYYKYYALERNSNGTLATDQNGNNYIRIELIDNPFSKRPFVNNTEYGFNGWVCNDEGESSPNICDSTTIRFDKNTYTRYLDVAVDGGSEIVIYLNASWYKANVVTSYYNITNFESMSMQQIPTHAIQVVVHHIANILWKQNYTTMDYYATYQYNSNYMPSGYYYKTSQNGTTYYRIRNSRTSCNYNNCYVYSANTSGITRGSVYDGTTVEFFPNYNANSNTLYATTVSSYNSSYMNLEEDPNGSYEYDETVTKYVLDLANGSTASGFFYKVNNPTTAMINTNEYYNSNGALCTSASSCTTAYKLIQYNDSLNNSDGTSIYTINTGNDSLIVDQANYYYLVTRDLNIFRYTSTSALTMSNLEVNRPFTVTGTSATGTSPTGVLQYPSSGGWFGNSYSDFEVSNDLVIENINIYGPDTAGNNNTALGGDSKTSQVIYSDSHNLKIGRNVFSSRNDTYLVAESVFGGTNNSVSGNFKVIIESGYYYAYHSGAMSGSNNATLNELTILGSDFDRANNNDNSKLRFIIGLDGYAAGSHTAGSVSLFASYTVVKSGSFGFNSDGTPNTDNTAGMYIGGRASKCVNSLTGVKVEGGLVNTILGGYGYNGTSTTNSTYIGVSGGTVREIYGGAGHSTTVGNRIINVTGGQINYSILGGSDSFSSNDTNDGIVEGSSLIYVGGNTIVGDQSTDTLNGVESGSVFGAGGGNSSSTAKGTVFNSHVIINGGTIRGSVYGGGNFGSTGTQSNTSATALIEIKDGNITSVYGGSKSAGFSKAEYAQSSTIDINITGGTIGSVYGGSNDSGTINGSINIDITGGTISNNVYGGGRGDQTFVSNDINVTIGQTSTAGKPIINGNIYGGSAFGTVNATTTNGSANGDTTVTVNNGIITGSVFGGGQGNSTYIPYVLGNIEVIINGGDITSVFGGNDQAGSHLANNEVHLNGGTIGSVYGGGNRSSVNNTNVYLDGSNVTNIYGGSNTLGDVITTNVDINSGSVGNVYGGNNEGGTCGTTDVNVTGTAIISNTVYGGGNQVNTTSTTVTLNSASGTIPNVYGGGNSANVTTSNVINNGVTATNIFGGSNSSGTVSTSNITNNSGNITNIYGGNNAGGNTLESNINFIGGVATTIYGGGNQANGDASNVSISGGNITTIFGGGNSAGLNDTTINVTSGTISDIYGGSNNTGDVSTSSITVNNATSINNIYGGGNRAKVSTPTITINNGTIGNVYGGGNLAEVTGNTIIDINGGTITNVYGGGNFGVVKGDSNVTITDATILGNAYGGGNGATATLEGNTNITIDGTTVIGTSSSVSPNAGCVFGGGNQAYTGVEANNDSSTNVNIVGGTINGNVYGGAKFSVIYGNTTVNIGKSAQVNNNLVSSDIYIKGHIFGGGEANSSGSEIYDWSFISVTQGTNITVDADTYSNFAIDGSFYGGGNASSASGDSNLLIENYGIKGNPKQNISIQRFTYVTIDNSSILLKGAIDRANDYGTELFSLSRIDNLKIKNNTEMYFETGANLLKKFSSVDSNDNIASVTIDENTNTLTRNVDNRIYMYEGKNLNIAKDQQVTDYGEVSGMTFLGMFNYDNNHNVNTGIYHSRYNAGDTLDWSGTFSRGSYVLGSHLANHNIKVNGFYSNFINEETAINEVNYINPTPSSARFYMWFIGENVIEYNVNLVASKYSTLGSVEASFLEFSKPNTSFQILNFDSSEIAPGISLIDKNDIPRIASVQADANTKFGLSMEASNSGWLTNGKTSFYTREPSISGVTYYEGENTNTVPTMLFYLYHSKNISEEKDLGTVRISVMAITKLNALSNEIKRLVINVNMSTALFQTTEYEGAMTPGDKYELFASTANNITTKSKLSAYYGLYADNTNLYRPGYHRALSSSFVLPVGTKITMLDLSLGTPEYYYHVIDATDYASAQTEFNTEGECSYNLSIFTKMGSKSNNSNYDDATMNNSYYNGTDSSEEFIFIVDFSDTQISQNELNHTLLLEIRDGNEESIITVLGIQHSQLTYNLYYGLDASINPTITASTNPLYVGYNDIFDTTINYTGSTLNGTDIIDTQFFDDKLGAQIYIKNSQGNIVSGTDLTGTYFTVDGKRYYPDINGYTHIKLSDKVGNIQKWIIFNTENSSLPTGDYTFVIENFASPDGIYYSSGNPVVTNIPVTIISTTYGLNPIISDESTILSVNNNEEMTFTIDYTSLLSNPNIRVAMYRRKYDEIYDTNYELVDFQDFIDLEMVEYNTKEYLLINSPNATNNFTLPMNSELTSGTYRLVFRLYDNDTKIGEIIRYIIVK